MANKKKQQSESELKQKLFNDAMKKRKMERLKELIDTLENLDKWIKEQDKKRSVQQEYLKKFR